MLQAHSRKFRGVAANAEQWRVVDRDLASRFALLWDMAGQPQAPRRQERQEPWTVVEVLKLLDQWGVDAFARLSWPDQDHPPASAPA